MKMQVTIKLELTDMIWTAEPRSALAVIRKYCPFINSGELASKLTEQALLIDQLYKDGASAIELDKKMLALKQLATGLNVTAAKGMGFIPEYQETLEQLPYFRSVIGVDLLIDEEDCYGK